MKYIDFELQIKQDEQGRYTVSCPIDRGGQDEEPFTLPFSDDQVKKVIKSIEDAISGRRSSSLSPNLVSEFGKQLFDALFTGRIRDRFSAEYRAALDNDGRLRIKLHIMPPNLMGLPWEFLYSEPFGGFLALSHDTVLTRYAKGRNPRRLPDGLVPPLRILGMVSSPRRVPELNAAEEKRRILLALNGLIERGLVWIDWLEEATLDALSRQLQTRDRDYHIFHFIGHGVFENEGYLVFEDRDGDPELIDGDTLGLVLAGQPYLRLAMLNACESAQISANNPFASVATALVRQGIPAIIAMQYAIPDKDAINFSNQIYQALAQMQPIERAMTDGRVALSRRQSRQWGIPVLYLGIPGQEIFPHFSFDPERLESKIRELIEERSWEEAIRLCNLLKTKVPRLYNRAVCLQALAQARIYEKVQDWEKVLVCCHEGQRLVEAGDPDNDEHFENLRRRAYTELEIVTLLEQARREFKAGHPIKVREICDQIFKRRWNESQAKALLQGIKAEEDLNGHRHQLDENLRRRDWPATLQIAELALRSVGVIDPQAAGVEFPNHAHFSELSKLAAAHLKAQEYLEKGSWEYAEMTLQDICARRSDLCPKADLLYVQSRQLLAIGKKSEAISRLERLQSIEPAYRDAAQLLQNLIAEDKERDRLYREVEEHLNNMQWTEALDLCKRITVFTRPKIDDTITSLGAALEQILALLPKLQSSLVADPGLLWPGGMPYDIFARLSISPQSSIEAVNNASYDLQLQQSGMSAEEQTAWDCLRSVPHRLYLDAFLYPVNRPERIVKFLGTSLTQRRSLPSSEQLKEGSPDDAAIVLLLMGHRALAAQLWEDMQRENPSDSSIAHKLGLLYYWWAQEDMTQGQWHKAIGNWAIALEDEAIWEKWGEERSALYGASVVTHLGKLRQKLESKFAEDLIPHADLGLTFHTELAAARMLKEAGGLPVPGSMFDKIACGPIMIAALSLETQLARFTAQHSAAAQDIGKRIEHLDNSTDLLQRYFSQVRRAAVLLDRDQPELALAELAQTDYSACPKDVRCPSRDVKTDFPRVYCATCPHFARANPAYMHLPDKGQAVLDDALDIAIAAHLRLAEQILTSPTRVVSTAAQHWRRAVALAASTSKSSSRLEEVRLSIEEIALGRARFLLQKANEEDESTFTWYDEINELYVLSTEIAGQSADFMSVQADAIALRGIQRANLLEDPVGSEGDLRKAFELKPSSIHIREQLVTAKKQLAIFAEAKGELARSKQILEEAQRLAIYGLEAHPEREELKEQLEDIELLLASWNSDNDVLVHRAYLDEVEHLEQQLQQTPTNKTLLANLLEALRRYSEDLSAEDQHALAVVELERRLPFFPDDTQLRNQIKFIREGYKVEGHLRAADLKFGELVDSQANRTFRLPFESTPPLDIKVLVDVVGDVAITSAAFPPAVDAGNSQMLLTMLQAFQDMPFYKPCWDGATQEMTIAAGTPVALLTYEVLEAIVRIAARCVKVNPTIANSPQEMNDHLKSAFMHFTEPLLGRPLALDLIPSVCRRANISCQSRSDGICILRRTPTSPEVLASRTDIAVHLSIEAGRLRNWSYASYLQLTTINAAMMICKVALDPQQNIVFMYELPHLNEEWLSTALEDLETYALRFGKALV